MKEYLKLKQVANRQTLRYIAEYIRASKRFATARLPTSSSRTTSSCSNRRDTDFTDICKAIINYMISII